MKKILLLLCTSLLLSMLLFSCAQREQEPLHTQSPIVILYTNDVHAAVGKNIGFSGLLAYKNEMHAAHGADNVLLVDCGDAIQGENIAMLTKGEAVVDLMNEVGYDYIILGNHEFDYGMEQMLSLSEKVEAHIIATNFIDLENNKPVFAPYIIHTVDNVDIAFLGITTPETITGAGGQHFKDDAGHFIYTLGEDASGQRLYAMVQESVDKARAEGADFVIALAHLGLEDAAKPWRSTDLIAHTSGIDVLLDGHSHSILESEVHSNALGNPVLLSQTGSKMRYIGQLTIDMSNLDNVLSTQLISEEGITWPKDAAMQASVDAAQANFTQMLAQEIAYSPYDLIAFTESQEPVRKVENNLGNLIADAYKTLLDTDVAIVNAGGIRSNIRKGSISFQDIIDIHPFSNHIISIQVSGKDIKDALEMAARLAPLANGGFLQVSGIQFSIDTSIPSSVQTDTYGNFLSVDGAYRVKDILINGKALDEKALYTLASHDYLIKRGGDGLAMFQACPILMDMYMLDSDALINYIKDNLGGNLGEGYRNPQGDGRITIF